MKLPHLKNRKFPRVAPKPMEEKLVQGSESDHMEDYCVGELFDACEQRDPKAFLAAVEALVLNCFDYEGGEDDQERTA